MKEPTNGDFETQCFFQPLSRVVGQRGADRGGNILGLDRSQMKQNAIILLASIAVRHEAEEELARQKMMAWKDEIEEYSRSIDGLLPFIYMNYADGSQDVIAHYGRESVEKMRRLSDKYDPDGVFHTREPGGFKIPKVD